MRFRTADEPQRCFGAPPSLGCRDTSVFQRHLHVVPRTLAWQQHILLEDKAELPYAHAGEGIGRQRADLFAV
jgi:hypothetical protein